MKKIFSAILILFAIFPVFAQEENNQELNPEIKELTDYRDVVNQIYHTGLPQRNIDMLKAFLPVVEKGFNKIKKAELPGILLYKKLKWEDGIKKMSICIDIYKIAATKKDPSSLLNAAEKFCAQYEALVRLIKPAMKETEVIHQILYLLEHYYLPKDEHEKIKAATTLLLTKMEELNKALLPQRIKGKEDKFALAKTELGAAISKLDETIKKENNKKEIEKTTAVVSAKYYELDKLFD